MEESDNTEEELSLYQLSTSAIVRNFSALRDDILQCSDKILFDVFYQVFHQKTVSLLGKPVFSNIDEFPENFRKGGGTVG